MASNSASIAVFCTPEAGHFQALRCVISRLAARGMRAHVFTHRSFEHEVTRCGGRFINLFEKYPIEKADPLSRPVPCRYVSFAGQFADQVIADVRAVNPSLILYETFSVIGPVVAQALQVPYVNVCVNHNPHPERCLDSLRSDRRVAISEMCLRAVERLREEFELRDASPFSYVTSLSPHLNIYCEPPEFLDAEDRSVFEPLAFFGCLPDRPGTSIESSRFDSYFKCDAAAPLRVYVSFGTVVWRYFGPEASAALRAIADACNGMEEVRTLISLGGHGLDAGFTESLAGKRVRVASFVDQPAVLQQADVFITHHGLNSTHEAVFHRVPMVSYPFFSDQPALARKCQSLGLAVPLGESVRAPVCSADVQSALQTVRQRRFALARALDRAREWEVRVIESRGTTIARLEELMRANPAPQRSSRS